MNRKKAYSYWAKKTIEGERELSEKEQQRYRDHYSLLPLFERARERGLIDLLARLKIDSRNFEMKGVEIKISYDLMAIIFTARFYAGDYEFTCTTSEHLLAYHNSLDLIPSDVFEKGQILVSGPRKYPDDSMTTLNFEEDLRLQKEGRVLE